MNDHWRQQINQMFKNLPHGLEDERWIVSKRMLELYEDMLAKLEVEPKHVPMTRPLDGPRWTERARKPRPWPCCVPMKREIRTGRMRVCHGPYVHKVTGWFWCESDRHYGSSQFHFCPFCGCPMPVPTWSRNGWRLPK